MGAGWAEVGKGENSDNYNSINNEIFKFKKECNRQFSAVFYMCLISQIKTLLN